jgi:ParB family chromosome partitioning protein
MPWRATAALRWRAIATRSAFVVARINPVRFQRGAKADFDETIEKMLSAARKFKADSVKPEQLARAGGAADE